MKRNCNATTFTGLPGRVLFLSGALLWLLFVSSATQSATLTDTLQIFPGYDQKLISNNNPSPVADGEPEFYGLDVVGSDDANTTVLKVSSQPANEDDTVAAVPLPAAAWLFGSALVGFVLLSNRRSV